MNVRLLHRRPGRHRRPAAVALDPYACHCVVHHPTTQAERDRVVDGIVQALKVGDQDHASYLRTQLSTICPAVMRPLCPCGCGRLPSEHNEMKAAA